MTKANNWFDVDKEGLRKVIAHLKKGRIIAELIQNAWDENPKKVDVLLSASAKGRFAVLSVEDDSPEGFDDLSHSYTLFAESKKKGNAEKRGRYNLGEKLVTSICKEAMVESTTGAVAFDGDGVRRLKPESKREFGSKFTGTLSMTQVEIEEAVEFLMGLLVPADIQMTVNGVQVAKRIPVAVFDATLPTEIADTNGVLRRTQRKTRVELYVPRAGESSQLYEMGLPVVETGDKWHVNVGQKVPQTMSRDNVPPAYLKAVRVNVLNHMHREITVEDAGTAWVQEATSHPDCNGQAITAFLDHKFGTDRAAYDPSDKEAGKAIQAKGGTVVTGSMMNRAQWSNAKEAGAIKPAGQIMPTARPYSDDSNASSARFLPPEEWTSGMRNIAGYAKFLASELMGLDLSVLIVDTANPFSACYGRGEITFNVHHLKPEWFDNGPGLAVDQLVIHEFGHEYCDDHLSHDYHKALCMLAAKLKHLAIKQPDRLAVFADPIAQAAG